MHGPRVVLLTDCSTGTGRVTAERLSRAGSLSFADIRWQFETDAYGTLRLAQLVLLGAGATGSGRIVSIGSMGGTFTFPGGGAYHITNYAIEALSALLAFATRRFGVDLVFVPPGLIRAQVSSTAASAVSVDDGPRADFNAAVAKSTTESCITGQLSRVGRCLDSVASGLCQGDGLVGSGSSQPGAGSAAPQSARFEAAA